VKVKGSIFLFWSSKTEFFHKWTYLKGNTKKFLLTEGNNPRWKHEAVGRSEKQGDPMNPKTHTATSYEAHLMFQAVHMPVSTVLLSIAFGRQTD
jgi:hypothetical protein